MDDMGKVDWGFSADQKARELEKRVMVLELVLKEVLLHLLGSGVPAHLADRWRTLLRLPE